MSNNQKLQSYVCVWNACLNENYWYFVKTVIIGSVLINCHLIKFGFTLCIYFFLMKHIYLPSKNNYFYCTCSILMVMVRNNMIKYFSNKYIRFEPETTKLKLNFTRNIRKKKPMMMLVLMMPLYYKSFNTFKMNLRNRYFKFIVCVSVCLCGKYQKFWVTFESSLIIQRNVLGRQNTFTEHYTLYKHNIIKPQKMLSFIPFYS